jgi:hypothetical protein
MPGTAIPFLGLYFTPSIRLFQGQKAAFYPRLVATFRKKTGAMQKIRFLM